MCRARSAATERKRERVSGMEGEQCGGSETGTKTATSTPTLSTVAVLASPPNRRPLTSRASLPLPLPLPLLLMIMLLWRRRRCCCVADFAGLVVVLWLRLLFSVPLFLRALFRFSSFFCSPLYFLYLAPVDWVFLFRLAASGCVLILFIFFGNILFFFSLPQDLSCCFSFGIFTI